MSGQSRIKYLDVLRLLATFFVVTLHVSCIFLRENTSGYYIAVSYDTLSRWCVPIFVMISGALFIHPSKQISFKEIYTKYIIRLFTVFVVWYLLYRYVFDPIYPIIHSVNHRLPISYEISSSWEPKYHLWFLLMMIGLYMLIPIFREIGHNKKICAYFLILWFCYITCDMLFQQNILRLNILSYLFYDLQIHMVLGYSGYFLLGYYLSQITIGKELYKISWFVFILLLIVTCAVTIYLKNYNFFEYLMPNIILISASLFIIIRYVVEKGRLIKLTYIAEKAQKNLFGIYLLHAFIISIIPPMLKPRGWETIFFVPLVSIVVFAISYLSINLLRKIPYVRYILS